MGERRVKMPSFYMPRRGLLPTSGYGTFSFQNWDRINVCCLNCTVCGVCHHSPRTLIHRSRVFYVKKVTLKDKDLAEMYPTWGKEITQHQPLSPSSLIEGGREKAKRHLGRLQCGDMSTEWKR